MFKSSDLLKATCAAIALSLGVSSASAEDYDIAAGVDVDFGHIIGFYKEFHQNPELSFKEARTSATLVKEMTSLGFEVTDKVGSDWTLKKAKADAGEVLPGVDGYGVVAVMRNGEGPTVMIRTDMDALPLKEHTGVPYASQVVDTDYLGQEAPVMHACGHDVHMASWLGAARQLAYNKDKWSGTLVMIAQPAEELGLGALAMLDDGLFKRFPVPDYNIALHVTGEAPAGVVAYASGPALASVDSIDIIVKGVGGHGAYPHRAKDPIVVGSQIVLALQTLVSREINPIEDGVVTVGSFRAGFKHNIIPDEAHLKITVRSYSEEVRNKLVDGIKRIAEAQAISAGLPKDKMPEVRVEKDNLISTFNTPSLAQRVSGVLRAELGAEAVFEAPPVMGGEDFAFYGKTKEKIPSFIFWVGGSDPVAFAKAAAGKGLKPSSIHSPLFAPVPDPTLRVGVRSLTATALDLFNNEPE